MIFYKTVLSDGDNVQKAGDIKFAPLEEDYANAIADTVEAEAEEWRLSINNEWMHADDLHDTRDTCSSHSFKNFDTPEVKGILVSNGHFGGVVLFLEFSHGGGMSSYRDKYYCILHANGKISGKNQAGSTFTGEDSDSEDINTYTLINIHGNKPVEEAKKQEGIFIYEVCRGQESSCILVGIESESIGDLKIPETLAGYTVRSIAPAICKEREDITSLVIPDSVEEIGEQAFAKCTNMRVLQIGKGLCGIGENNVYHGAGSFYACSNLEEIRVHPKNKHFRSHGNCLIKIQNELWLGTPLNRDALILGCKNTDMTAAKELYSIEHFAFYGCEGLQEIVVPKSVYSIGRSAFENCTGLKKAILFKGANMTTAICSLAFAGCTSLEYVFIEKSLYRADDNTFKNCTALKEICFGGTHADWKKVRTTYNYLLSLDIPVLCEQTPEW